jgi:catecholate siderophore receptor
VLDLFATYRINKNMDVRLNVGNVTDKDYYVAGYRSGSFLYKGDARNARVTLNYDF